MPDFGQTAAENRIACWLKREGDRVERGDVLAEVETDKVTVQVEVFTGGYLRQILHQSSAIVAAGEPIAVLSQLPDESLDAGDTPPAGNQSTRTQQAAPQTPERMPVPSRSAPAAADPGLARARVPDAAGSGILATPMARRVALDLGVDIALVTGSGTGGRILLEDVRAQAAEARAVAPLAGVDERRIPPTGEASAETADDTSSDVELSPARKVTASRMLRSVQEAPQFSMSVDVELAEIERLRARWESAGRNRPSYTALLVKVVAAALSRHPQMNVAFDRGRLRRFHHVNVGVATATPHGLFVPVIPDADRLSLGDLQAAIGAIRDQANSGRLSPRTGVFATFTLSNLGMYGIDRFTAILNPPEAGILAVGRIAHRPVAVGVAIESRLVATLTLTADHRAVDGVEAAVFLMDVCRLLQNLYELL
jgi:pyruvate dehydrogenase E2 component (dihydrolipoamide acetyltransferase)